MAAKRNIPTADIASNPILKAAYEEALRKEPVQSDFKKAARESDPTTLKSIKDLTEVVKKQDKQSSDIAKYLKRIDRNTENTSENMKVLSETLLDVVRELRELRDAEKRDGQDTEDLLEKIDEDIKKKEGVGGEKNLSSLTGMLGLLTTNLGKIAAGLGLVGGLALNQKIKSWMDSPEGKEWQEKTRQRKIEQGWTQENFPQLTEYIRKYYGIKDTLESSFGFSLGGRTQKEWEQAHGIRPENEVSQSVIESQRKTEETLKGRVPGAAPAGAETKEGVTPAGAPPGVTQTMGAPVAEQSITNTVMAKQVYDYLISKGVDHIHAVGILANIQRESGFDSGIVGDKGTSFGLFQHHLDRAQRMKAVAGAGGQDWQKNWKGQIDYALTEPDMKMYLAKSFADSAAASDAFVTLFERPKNPVSDQATSRSYIKDIEKKVSVAGGQFSAGLPDTSAAMAAVGSTNTNTPQLAAIPSAGSAPTPQTSPVSWTDPGKKENEWRASAQQQTAAPSSASVGVQAGNPEPQSSATKVSESNVKLIERYGPGRPGRPDDSILNIAKKAAAATGMSSITASSGKGDTISAAGRARGQKTTMHSTGLAVDLVGFSNDQQKLEFIKNAKAAGAKGVGVYNNGSVHIDLGRERSWNWGFKDDAAFKSAVGTGASREAGVSAPGAGGMGDVARPAGPPMPTTAAIPLPPTRPPEFSQQTATPMTPAFPGMAMPGMMGMGGGLFGMIGGLLGGIGDALGGLFGSIFGEEQMQFAGAEPGAPNLVNAPLPPRRPDRFPAPAGTPLPPRRPSAEMMKPQPQRAAPLPPPRPPTFSSANLGPSISQTNMAAQNVRDGEGSMPSGGLRPTWLDNSPFPHMLTAGYSGHKQKGSTLPT